MSKQNAEEFLAEATRDPGLKRKLLAAAATAKTWLGEAGTAGYEMTSDELRAAAEVLVGRPVKTDELVGVLRGLVEGELQDDSLDAVSGGAGVAKPPAKPLQVNKVRSAVGGDVGANAVFDKESGPIGPIGDVNQQRGGRTSGGG